MVENLSELKPRVVSVAEFAERYLYANSNGFALSFQGQIYCDSEAAGLNITLQKSMVTITAYSKGVIIDNNLDDRAALRKAQEQMATIDTVLGMAAQILTAKINSLSK